MVWAVVAAGEAAEGAAVVVAVVEGVNRLACGILEKRRVDLGGRIRHPPASTNVA